MATIHFILQGKGGVGKSMIASLLYQYFQKRNVPVRAFDTDPVNSTLAGYSEFNVTRIEIMKNGDINQRNFDTLMEGILDSNEGDQLIVDNGASSFVALGNYMKVNDAFSALVEEGNKVFLHTVITGGQALGDTINGLNELITNFSDMPIAVWLNPFFGEIEAYGKKFEEMPIYQSNGEKIHALIKLPITNSSMEGQDLSELFTLKQPFETGIESKPIMVKRRLKKYWDNVQFLLDSANIQ